MLDMLAAACFFVLPLLLLLLIRLWAVLPRRCGAAEAFALSGQDTPSQETLPGCHVLAVLGSGGHTMEMLRLLSTLDRRFSPLTYVVSETDKLSAAKAVAREEAVAARGTPSEYKVLKIPRSREVGQSWMRSAIASVKAVLFCFPVVLGEMPDVILCNGPGTCVPICVISYIPRLLGIKRIRLLYAESICRVKSLSLSARLLYPFVDHMLVQWPQLKERYPGTEYIGRLT